MPTTSVSMTYAGCPVYDPRKLYSEYQRIVAEQPDTWPGISLEFWGRANSYICPIGPYAGRAWLLMRRGDVVGLNQNLFGELLRIEDGGKVYETTLWMLSAKCMTPGASEDEDSIYLVELADCRFILERFGTWATVGGFYASTEFPSTSIAVYQYNVRKPAPNSISTDGTDADEFYTNSLNSGSPWTWSTMCENLWYPYNQNSYIGSTFPGLPYTPTGVPEGIDLYAGGRWFNMEDVLQHIGCTLRYDPWTPGTFQNGLIGRGLTGIVRLGETTQEDFDVALKNSRQAGTLLFDGGYIENPLSKFPARVGVRFPKADFHTGSENLFLNTNNADASHYYTYDVRISDVYSDIDPVADVFGAGSVLIYDIMTALMGFSGTTVSAQVVLNKTLLNARAVEVATNWFNIRRYTDARRHYVISGHADVVPGSLVKAVIYGDIGAGYMTTILSYPGPPEKVLSAGRDASGRITGLGLDIAHWEQENDNSVIKASPGDFRKNIAQHPLIRYPETALVYVVAGTEPDSNGAYAAKIVRANPAGNFLNPGTSTNYVTGEDCYVVVMPGPVRGTANGVGELYQRHLFVRLAGTYPTGEKPLYVADNGTMGVGAVASATYNSGSWTARKSINITQSGGTFTIHHPGLYIAVGSWNGSTGNIIGPEYTANGGNAGSTIQKLTAGQTFVFSAPATSGDFVVAKIFHAD